MELQNKLVKVAQLQENQSIELGIQSIESGAGTEKISFELPRGWRLPRNLQNKGHSVRNCRTRKFDVPKGLVRWVPKSITNNSGPKFNKVPMPQT